MRFDITTSINVRNAMFLAVKPCLADRRQISEENTSCLFTIGAWALKMEAERSSEMYVSAFQTTRCHIPEDKSSKLITPFLK